MTPEQHARSEEIAKRCLAIFSELDLIDENIEALEEANASYAQCELDKERLEAELRTLEDEADALHNQHIAPETLAHIHEWLAVGSFTLCAVTVQPGYTPVYTITIERSGWGAPTRATAAFAVTCCYQADAPSTFPAHLVDREIHAGRIALLTEPWGCYHLQGNLMAWSEEGGVE